MADKHDILSRDRLFLDISKKKLKVDPEKTQAIFPKKLKQVC